MTTKQKRTGPKRPPHSVYFIKEAARAGKYLEAQNACDANELWHRDQGAEMRDLFIKIEKMKRGKKIDL